MFVLFFDAGHVVLEGNDITALPVRGSGKKILGQKRPVGLASSLEATERKLDWYIFHRRGQHLEVCFPSGTRSSDVFVVGDSKRQ
jgi:hypothetical protein